MSELGGSCGLQGKNPHLIELFIDPAEADRSMLPMISRRSILTLDSLAAQAAQAGSSGQADGGLTCFSSFVAGSGSLHTSMQRTRALPFRYVSAIQPSYIPQLCAPDAYRAALLLLAIQPCVCAANIRRALTQASCRAGFTQQTLSSCWFAATSDAWVAAGKLHLPTWALWRTVSAAPLASPC